MRLFLVRHGQTAWNLEGRAQGHTDILLDELGRQQASMAAEAFRGTELTRVLTSDLQRAITTAEPLAKATGATLTQRHDLRERSFGDWEGLDFRDVAAKMLEQSLLQGIPMHEVRPPAGESFADVWQRLDGVLAELKDAEGPTAVVSHGGTVSILLSRLLCGTLETSRSFRFGNTSITELERRPDGYFSIVRYNDVAHLQRQTVLSGSLDGTSR